MNLPVQASPEHRDRRPLRWLAPAAVLAAGTLAAGASSALAATASPSSFNANPLAGETVTWISVSPAFSRTGTVLAASQSGGCSTSRQCAHLWLTHDGGYTWQRAQAQNYAGTHPTVAVDGAGHEVILATGSNGVLRSDDGGDTFTVVGHNGGVPTASPTFARDGMVAAAGSPDYVIHGSEVKSIAGSNGEMNDGFFAFSPEFPGGGSNPPALLGGLDPKTANPMVATCDSNLSCGHATPLAGAGTMAGVPNIYLSDAFASDGTVFAQTAAGIFKSTNGARAFTLLPIGLSGATATATAELALAPGYQEHGPVRTAYAALIQIMGAGSSAKRVGGIYRTTDGGSSWAPLYSPGPFDEGALAVAVAPGGRIFASYIDKNGATGTLCSPDGGTSWQPTCPAIATAAAAGQSSQRSSSSACTSSCGAAAKGKSGLSVNATSTSSSATASGGGQTNGTRAQAPNALTGAHAATNRPWLIPLIIAIVLAVAAGIAGVVRQRKERSPA